MHLMFVAVALLFSLQFNFFFRNVGKIPCSVYGIRLFLKPWTFWYNPALPSTTRNPEKER